MTRVTGPRARPVLAGAPGVSHTHKEHRIQITFTLRRGALGLLASLALLAAGCGGSEEEGTSRESGAEASVEQAAERKGGSGKDFCSAVSEQVRKAFDPEAVDATIGDSERISEDLGEMVRALRAVRAPSEIAEDWKKTVDSLAEMAELFSDIDPNDPDVARKLVEKSDAIEAKQDEWMKAADRVQRYVVANCGDRG